MNALLMRVLSLHGVFDKGIILARLKGPNAYLPLILKK